MASDWMDLAHYSDSYGFQVDRPRPDMWPWRDWVVRSFNDNLPWDKFTLWQVAGDLLPHATDEQVLATAFNRLHQQESEGGSVEEEYRVNYVNDRVTTFGTAFLGLTLECCRCHDHKFDPLPQKDFYSLFAFFDDIDEAGLYSYFTPAARASVVEWIAGKAAQPAAFEAAGCTLPHEIVHYSFDGRGQDGKFANQVGSQEPATSPGENTIVSDTRGGSPCLAIKLTGDHPVTTPVGNFGQPLMSHLWGAGFLPTKHQAVRFRFGADPVLYVNNPPGVSTENRRQLHEHQFAGTRPGLPTTKWPSGCRRACRR